MIVRYEANEIPTEATPAWTRIGNAPDIESVSGGILTIGEALPMSQTTRPWYFLEDTNISNAIGLVIDARIKVVTSNEAGGYGCILGVELGADEPWAYLYLNEDKIMISEGVVAPDEYAMDTTDDFHIYRFTVKDSVCKGYVDGVLRVQATLNNTSGTGKYIEFGTFGRIPWEHQWDYVCFDTTGTPWASLGADKKQPSGYHCFMSQYIKNVVSARVPLKTPDGVNKLW